MPLSPLGFGDRGGEPVGLTGATELVLPLTTLAPTARGGFYCYLDLPGCSLRTTPDLGLPTFPEGVDGAARQ